MLSALIAKATTARTQPRKWIKNTKNINTNLIIIVNTSHHCRCRYTTHRTLSHVPFACSALHSRHSCHASRPQSPMCAIFAVCIIFSYKSLLYYLVCSIRHSVPLSLKPHSSHTHTHKRIMVTRMKEMPSSSQTLYTRIPNTCRDQQHNRQKKK